MTELLDREYGFVTAVDPFRCCLWELNNRIEGYLNEVSCRTEIENVLRNGQQIPVVGRRVQGDPTFDVEVICGARRLFVARHLKTPLRVEIRDLTDRQAAAAVEAEVSLRKTASPYERGLWLAKLLRQGLYRSQDEMARELAIAPTQVNRLLKFAELPPVVIAAFSSPHDILESWAVELCKALSDERRRLVTERSRALEKRAPRPPAVSIYEMLLASRGAGTRRRRRAAARVVKSPTGEPLLRFERQRKDVVLRIPNSRLDAGIEKALTQAVAAVLTRRTPDESAASAGRRAYQGVE